MASIKDLKRRFYDSGYFETTAPMAFENKRWDGQDFSRTFFEHSVTFKQCRFVNANFNNCQFNQNAIFSFYRCDLINTSFTGAFIGGKMHFDESDIRSAIFNNIDQLTNKIQNGTVTFNKVKYVDDADFANEAINAVIKLLNKIN